MKKIILLGIIVLVVFSCGPKPPPQPEAPQVNPEAYRLYLKGWHFRNLGTRESFPKAVEYLEQAVALDPDFAQAYAVLAHTYFVMGNLGQWDRDYAYNRMKEALDKALELDPDNVYARYEYGYFLCNTGRPDEALAEYRRALELDPLYPEPLEGIGEAYRYTRQYDKALEYLQEVSELQPDNIYALRQEDWIKREILMQQGRYAEAAAEAEKAGDFFQQLRAEWALGNREKVYAIRDSLRSTTALQQREQVSPIWAARLYAIMGERDKALDLLENTALRRGLVYDSDFDSLRAEPRFKALLQNRGLTEVFDQYGQRIR